MDMELINQISHIQQISISQKMVEYLEILQMPGIELDRYIEEMVQTNPLLDFEPSEDWPEVWTEHNNEYYSNSDKDAIFDDYQEEGDFLSNTNASVSLREYLKHQMMELKIQPQYIKAAFYLIENIDADGYIREEISDLANITKIPERVFDNALKIIQSLEPAGIGAGNLKECLLLQLKRKKALSEDAAYIIENFFNLLASKSFLKISRESGIKVDKIEDIYNLIKSLNPKPGYAFSKNELNPYVIPDLILREVYDEYILMFNDESINNIKINKQYANIITDCNADRALKNYIKKKLSAATALVKAIEQRKSNMLDVANFIVDVQKEFFKRGFKYLKPLTMQMAADKLKINVSTVSRIVNGKYMQTPRGIFELRFFFSSTLDTEFENKMSGSGVKDLIRKIVQEEDKKNPFSDEQIKEILKANGIQVARRTISKYRQMLSILPAALRKS